MQSNTRKIKRKSDFTFVRLLGSFWNILIILLLPFAVCGVAHTASDVIGTLSFSNQSVAAKQLENAQAVLMTQGLNLDPRTNASNDVQNALKVMDRVVAENVKRSELIINEGGQTPLEALITVLSEYRNEMYLRKDATKLLAACTAQVNEGLKTLIITSPTTTTVNLKAASDLTKGLRGLIASIVELSTSELQAVEDLVDKNATSESGLPTPMLLPADGVNSTLTQQDVGSELGVISLSCTGCDAF